MDIAYLYRLIYFIFAGLLTVFLLDKMTSPWDRRMGVKQKLFTIHPDIIYPLVIAYYIGNRPYDTGFFGDTGAYVHELSMMRGDIFKFDFGVNNLIWDNFFQYAGCTGMNASVFFTIIALIYFLGIYFACSKIFPENHTIAFCVYLCGLSTYSFGMNGIKNGAAASLMLMAIAYHKNLKISILFVLLSWGFHHAMVLPVGAYIAMRFVKNPIYYFYFWLFSLVMAAFHVTFFQTLFASFADDQGAKYLVEEGGSYRTGFRLDFILYSAVPIYFGYRMIDKYKLADEFYKVILVLFLFTNGVWMLCMYANYTNRIAYLSWFMYPIILIYPFVNLKYSPKQLIEAKYIIMGHLAFTLFFMFFRKGVDI